MLENIRFGSEPAQQSPAATRRVMSAPGSCAAPNPMPGDRRWRCAGYSLDKLARATGALCPDESSFRPRGCAELDLALLTFNRARRVRLLRPLISSWPGPHGQSACLCPPAAGVCWRRIQSGDDARQRPQTVVATCDPAKFSPRLVWRRGDGLRRFRFGFRQPVTGFSLAHRQQTGGRPLCASSDLIPPRFLD